RGGSHDPALTRGINCKPSRRAALAQWQPLLASQEAAERAELRAVPYRLERLREDVAHVEGQAGIEAPPRIDERVVRDQRDGRGGLSLEIGIAVELHHLRDRQGRVELEAERILRRLQRAQLGLEDVDV